MAAAQAPASPEAAGTGKQCFVATPIGEVGTPTRLRADQVFRFILEPAARECGYTAIRSDQMPQPGLITTQILQHIINDDLVIADLTGHNPNVFYELAIRHAINKPVVQVIEQGTPIPFDLAAARTVQVDIHDLDSVASAKRQIVDQIRAIETGEVGSLSPVVEALEIAACTSDPPSGQQVMAEVLTVLGQIRICLADIDTRLRRLEAAAPLPPGRAA